MVRGCGAALLVAIAGCAVAQGHGEVPASDAALVARGQRLFLRCASCHDIAGAPIAKNGPTLRGVFGRPVASVEGFAYSPSLAAQSFVWDAARLDAWLERPTSIAPGTAMAFEGLPAAADRQAIIAYLKAQRR